jgi:hypothetical protein
MTDGAVVDGHFFPSETVFPCPETCAPTLRSPA